MKTHINSNDILITVNGKIQKVDEDYTIVDNRWQLNYPPKPGAVVKVYKREEDGKTNN